MSAAPPAPAVPGPLSESDAVMLSAYLDGELEEAERRALEARLEREPALRGELQALRAGREVLQEVSQSRPPAPPSVAFAAFGTTLVRALPEELPVALARKAPLARRAFIVAALAVACLAALTLAGRALRRWSGPPASGWRISTDRQGCSVLREGRVATLRGGDAFWAGDKLALELGVSATLVGPAGISAEAAGPATLVFGSGGTLFLEDGKVIVDGPNAAAARALKLRTRDGEIAAQETQDGFRIEVEAPRGAEKP